MNIKKYKIYEIFPILEPVHIKKDVGSIPEYLNKLGYETFIFAKKPFTVSNFSTAIVKLNVLNVLKYLKHEKGINKILLLYFFTLSTKRLCPLLFLKLYNPSLKIIVKTDGVLHGVIKGDDYFIKRIGKRMRAFFFFLFVKLDLIIVENISYKEQMLTVSKKLKDRVEVLPNGADESNYCLERQNREFKSVICVGNITFSKGCDDLLKAFDSVREKYPNWKLIFIGRLYDDFKETLDKYQSKIGSQLEMMGYIEGKHKHLYQEFVNGSIYVLCSKKESWNLALVEAMASKNAIISSLCGSAEYITDNGAAGYIYEQGNSEQLSGILDKLMGDPELRREKQNAAVSRFDKYFRWRRVVDNLDLMIKTLYHQK